jgi:hypothetical protein
MIILSCTTISRMEASLLSLDYETNPFRQFEKGISFISWDKYR